MHIVAISDLHGFLPEIPECDVLAIAGDICPLEDHSREFQRRWMLGPLSEWLRRQPARHVVATAGNHDLITENALGLAPQLPWHYLLNSSVTIDGVVFWGSPLSPPFGVGWAWNASEAVLENVYAKIPGNTDVVISHGPPYGARDRPYFGGTVGSIALRETLAKVKPMLVVCGHIHPSYGVDAILYEGGRTVVGNACIVNGLYEHVNDPLQFRLDKEVRHVQQIQVVE